jgi:hypothetical protein
MKISVPDTQPVERISAIEPAEFSARFELADRPCVLTGAVSDWRAISKSVFGSVFAGESPRKLAQ